MPGVSQGLLQARVLHRSWPPSGDQGLGEQVCQAQGLGFVCTLLGDYKNKTLNKYIILP